MRFLCILSPSESPLEIRYQAEFCAAHRLFREDWSEQRNTEVFGICANPNGHGHNYQLSVCVKGAIQEDTGMVMDFLALTALVQERILRWVDHRNLDLDVPFLQGRISTAENLLVVFWEQLEDGLPEGVTLASLSLAESRDYSCHYYGPQS